MKHLQSTETSDKPRLLLYSLILPVLWFAVGTIGTQIAPDKRLGIGGTAAVIYVAILAISWLIARKHKRQPTDSEKWRLIGYSVFFAVLLESMGLLYALVFPAEVGVEMTRNVAMFAIGFAALVNFLFIFVGFKYISPRFINWYLDRSAGNAA